MLKRISTFQSKLIGDKVTPLESKFKEILRMIPQSKSNYCTHGIHHYPAKFLPQYPSTFIPHLTDENDIILDPMCGAGTTLIEGLLLKRRVIGNDIDPLAVLISKVATTSIKYEEIRPFYDKLLKKIDNIIKNKIIKKVKIPSEEEFPNRLMWFREPVLKEIVCIREIINKVKNEKLNNFSTLVLSSILRDVSNADPRDIFPQRDANNLIRERKNVYIEFKKSFIKLQRKVMKFSERVNDINPPNIYLNDARKLPLRKQSVDMVFTSPPYSYAMDYSRVHKFSLLLLLQNRNEFNENSRKYLGTDKISVKDEIKDFRGIEFIEDILKNIIKKDRKWGICLYKYLIGMRDISKEMFRILRSDKKLIYVIGNSTIKKTKFDTAGVLKQISENVGFEFERSFIRPYYAYRMARKRNIQSNTIKADEFLIFRR